MDKMSVADILKTLQSIVPDNDDKPETPESNTKPEDAFMEFTVNSIFKSLNDENKHKCSNSESKCSQDESKPSSQSNDSFAKTINKCGQTISSSKNLNMYIDLLKMFFDNISDHKKVKLVDLFVQFVKEAVTTLLF